MIRYAIGFTIPTHDHDEIEKCHADDCECEYIQNFFHIPLTSHQSIWFSVSTSAKVLHFVCGDVFALTRFPYTNNFFFLRLKSFSDFELSFINSLCAKCLRYTQFLACVHRNTFTGVITIVRRSNLYGVLNCACYKNSSPHIKISRMALLRDAFAYPAAKRMKYAKKRENQLDSRICTSFINVSGFF